MPRLAPSITAAWRQHSPLLRPAFRAAQHTHTPSLGSLILLFPSARISIQICAVTVELCNALRQKSCYLTQPTPPGSKTQSAFQRTSGISQPCVKYCRQHNFHPTLSIHLRRETVRLKCLRPEWENTPQKQSQRYQAQPALLSPHKALLGHCYCWGPHHAWRTQQKPTALLCTQQFCREIMYQELTGQV